MLPPEDPFETHGEIRECLKCGEDFCTKDVLCIDYCDLHQPKSIDHPKPERIPVETTERLGESLKVMDRLEAEFNEEDVA